MDSDADAGMLKLPVRVAQLGACDPYAGQSHDADQLMQPVGLDDLDIVIQEEQERAACHHRAPVAGGGVVERTVDSDYPDIPTPFEFFVELPGFRIVRA